MTQQWMSVYASNDADAKAIYAYLKEHFEEIKAIAPSFDMDGGDWDYDEFGDDDEEDTDPLYGAILNSIEGTNDRT